MHQRDGTILHTPPDADELDARMERLLAFANASVDVGFVHPVVRAILLHFMIGYEHPFVDGNGRTARALFYWMMAKSGYWMTEFLSNLDDHPQVARPVRESLSLLRER